MERKVNTLSIALFTSLLMLPGALWAHDDEHQTEGGHGSPELYEEGSGMKMHSEKNGAYKERGEQGEHEKSSEYMEEGSGMKMHSGENGAHQKHGKQVKQEKSSDHMEEGSGMR